MAKLIFNSSDSLTLREFFSLRIFVKLNPVKCSISVCVIVRISLFSYMVSNSL